MFSLPVLAEANSRLHADIAIIRLLRTGIRAEKISAIFQQDRAPNTVCCWLNDFHSLPIDSGVPIAAAGPLGRLFQSGRNEDVFQQELERLGLTRDLMTRLSEKAADGQMILCVHARSEAEAAVAWHIFYHVEAENITCPSGYVDHVAREQSALVQQWAEIAA